MISVGSFNRIFSEVLVSSCYCTVAFSDPTFFFTTQEGDSSLKCVQKWFVGLLADSGHKN